MAKSMALRAQMKYEAPKGGILPKNGTKMPSSSKKGLGFGAMLTKGCK